MPKLAQSKQLILPGEMETVRDSKIMVDGNCSYEIKTRLLFGRKVMTKLDSVFKSRDIIILTNVCTVSVMVSPVVMYG